MGKGTPGPWFSNNSRIYEGSERQFGQKLIAKTIGEFGDEEALANARMISLAPEMADALRGLVDMIPAEDEYDLVQAGYSQEEARAIKNARALLSRLEGDEP